MNIKTIIVDLDRTLLHTDKTISSYTAKILTECKKNAIRIMVATARPLRAIKEYCELVDFDAMVVSNGARVICGEQRKEYGICRESAARLLKALKQYPELKITLETGDCAYSNKFIDDYETVICDDLIAVANAEGVLKILVHIYKEEDLAIVKKELTEDLYYTIANGYLMQIMNKSATKWNGIKAMLDIHDCSCDEVAYFGDDNDDIEPMKMCGLGIAVSNAIDEVKAVADYITEDNDADGVAKFIEQNLLSFVLQYSRFLSEFEKGRNIVLSSSENNKVTSRMMSVVQHNGLFYFQTDKTFRKYRQLMNNPQIALCTGNIQIEGVCEEIGHPMNNALFCEIYKECFSSSFQKYSSLENERLFLVNPTYVERWVYVEGVPFIETFDVENREYKLTKYEL